MSAPDAGDGGPGPAPPPDSGAGLDIDYPRALLVALFLAVAAGLFVAGTTSATAFGAYNPAWDGAADLRALAADGGADAAVVRDVAAYDGAGDGAVAVVLSPTRPYTAAEAARVRAFVERGGTLVVAEDFGPHADPLLASVGASARVNGTLLRDERFHYRGPALPVVDTTGDHPLVRNVSGLTLNRGTAVDPGDARVLARTSEFAYRDADGDGALDGTETMAAFPVAAVEEVGDGRVVVVGDPSLFINAMLDRPGNRAFARSLLDAERVLLDYSHVGGVPPLVGAALVLRGSLPLQVLVGVGGVVGLAAWARRPGLAARLRGGGTDRGRPPVDPEAVVAAVRRRHPEYSEDRLRRVMGEILNDDDQPGADE